MKPVLFSFWRSLAAWRVRMALNLKNIEFDLSVVNLLEGDQFKDSFTHQNPEHSVPVLQMGEDTFAQSLAIIEYLNEAYDGKSLLPVDIKSRYLCRRFSLVSAADSHPVIVPRVRRLLAGEFGFNEAQVNEFCGYFMRRGCEAMEKLLSHTEYHSFSETGPYVLGSDVSMADLCLIPHIQGARNFGVDVSPYKKLLAIEEALFKLPEIEKAHPKYHPGFVKPE
ncbi:maleylacetoacetate isomerase [Alphaproteobacteria bacterium]|nr:maleylacetoacetate isomerase [Alphaproteobacteria bacterium]MDA9815565.1 maleylacetoacetate isomerase [Alphaproteobacteria bacterium]